MEGRRGRIEGRGDGEGRGKGGEDRNDNFFFFTLLTSLSKVRVESVEKQHCIIWNGYTTNFGCSLERLE